MSVYERNNIGYIAHISLIIQAEEVAELIEEGELNIEVGMLNIDLGDYIEEDDQDQFGLGV